MEENEVNRWGQKMVEQKRWLFHAPTLSIGIADEFFDGVEKVYRAAPDSAPLNGPAMKFNTGHVFVASTPDKTFMELAEREVAFVSLCQMKLTEFLKGAASFGQERGLPEQTFVTLMVSLLRAQTNALEVVEFGEVLR